MAGVHVEDAIWMLNMRKLEVVDKLTHDQVRKTERQKNRSDPVRITENRTTDVGQGPGAGCPGEA